MFRRSAKADSQRGTNSPGNEVVPQAAERIDDRRGASSDDRSRATSGTTDADRLHEYRMKLAEKVNAKDADSLLAATDEDMYRRHFRQKYWGPCLLMVVAAILVVGAFTWAQGVGLDARLVLPAVVTAVVAVATGRRLGVAREKNKGQRDKSATPDKE